MNHDDRSTRAVNIINFHSIQMLVVQHEGTEYIALKPLSDLAGIDWRNVKTSTKEHDVAVLLQPKWLLPPQMDAAGGDITPSKAALYIRFDRARMFLARIQARHMRAHDSINQSGNGRGEPLPAVERLRVAGEPGGRDCIVVAGLPQRLPVIRLIDRQAARVDFGKGQLIRVGQQRAERFARAIVVRRARRGVDGHVVGGHGGQQDTGSDQQARMRAECGSQGAAAAKDFKPSSDAGHAVVHATVTRAQPCEVFQVKQRFAFGAGQMTGIHGSPFSRRQVAPTDVHTPVRSDVPESAIARAAFRCACARCRRAVADACDVRGARSWFAPWGRMDGSRRHPTPRGASRQSPPIDGRQRAEGTLLRRPASDLAKLCGLSDQLPPQTGSAGGASPPKVRLYVPFVTGRASRPGPGACAERADPGSRAPLLDSAARKDATRRAQARKKVGK